MIFDQFEKDSVEELINYKGSDADVIRMKLMSARLIKEVRIALNQHIDDAIKAAASVLIQINA